MQQLMNSYFANGVSCTKVGMIDYMFETSLDTLLVDEIDKTSPKDEALFLNLMETGISERLDRLK